MLHMMLILIYISYFDQKNIFGQHLMTNLVFIIGVPVKHAFLGSFHRFQEIITLAKQFCRTPPKITVNGYK